MNNTNKSIIPIALTTFKSEAPTAAATIASATTTATRTTSTPPIRTKKH
jgi:hypothetical protein